MLAVISSAAPFFAYMAMLSAFHMCEYLLTAAFRPDTLNFDNFLLNHSTVYQVMISLSWVEYWLEYGLAPSRKCWGTISTAGLLLSLLGLGTRIIAMSTASSNFSHIIEEEQRPEHQLVTRGVYSCLRHPAYFGYFWWAVGTQVLLANPVCVCAYAVASFLFFRHRIPYEEHFLVRFFGEEYLRYRERTWIGIPGIRSIRPGELWATDS